ncbi:MAG: hypothetical protein ACYTHM_23525, partial [Planctomycetota bacterium]
YVNRVVAVSGEPEMLRYDLGPFKFPVLWYRRRRQEWRTHGRHGGRWVTLDKREKVFPFQLQFPDGGRMIIRATPTEVHGASSRIRTRGIVSRQRTIQEWIPVVPRLTILGRLILAKQTATIVPDKSAGMLFSRSDPKRAAQFEFLKGFAELAGCLAIVIGILVFFAHLNV